MFGARSILLSLCLTVLGVPGSPQTAPQHTGLRLTSPQEGEAIVQAAWELRHALIPKPDCSHFVHAVYTQAGFRYDYAGSRAIFDGIENFRRVTKPQAGDVVVWQGHIGIVIDPKEHSFYSSVNTGFAIESYQSHYWIGRGNPRFYRFIVNDLPSAPTLVDLALLSSAPGQGLFNLTKSFAAQPPILKQSNSADRAARESARVRPAQNQRQLAAMERRPVQIPPSKVATNDRQTSDEMLVTSRATPSKEEVLAAVLRSIDANGKRLLQGGSLNSQPSVGVVDRFRIVAINLQGNSGLADLEVRQMATFHYGKAIPTRMTARRNVILSRQEKGWVLVMPQDLICLDRFLAVTALTDHLGTLASTPANSPERKISVRLLNELRSGKSSGGVAAGSD